MAKMKIVGDIIQLKSDLTKEQFKRVEAFAPESLKLYDGDACYSKYGVCFCSEDAEGKLFMSTNNPVTDHSDPEKEREEIVKKFAPILNKLQLVEANILSAEEYLGEIEASVRDSVTFVN